MAWRREVWSAATAVAVRSVRKIFMIGLAWIGWVGVKVKKNEAAVISFGWKCLLFALGLDL